MTILPPTQAQASVPEVAPGELQVDLDENLVNLRTDFCWEKWFFWIRLWTNTNWWTLYTDWWLENGISIRQSRFLKAINLADISSLKTEIMSIPILHLLIPYSTFGMLECTSVVWRCVRLQNLSSRWIYWEWGILQLKGLSDLYLRRWLFFSLVSLATLKLTAGLKN